MIIHLPPVKNFIEANFPHSSPVFAREETYQGVLANPRSGLYTLTSPNGEVWTLHFKPAVSLASLKKVNEAVVKGHLGWTPFVVEEAEIFPLNFTLAEQGQAKSPDIPDLSNPSSPSNLPALYPSLAWEKTQTKTLIFTSQVASFPQEFINYYLENLKNQGFKQTLNSISPEGITITYAKDDLFLTFGVKNIYTGVGDNKKLTGFIAYLEHN